METQAGEASAGPNASRWARSALGLAVLVWIAVFVHLDLEAARAFAPLHRDLAIFAQIAHAAADSGRLSTSLELFGIVIQGGDELARELLASPEGGVSHLSSHFSPLLWLLALPWWVAPGATTLQVLHVFALGCAASTLFVYARARLGSEPIALGLALAYLFSPLTLNSAIDPFRESSLALPILPLLAWALLQARWKVAALSACALALLKEDLALWCALIGLAIAIRPRSASHRHAGVAMAIGGALTVLVGLWVTDALRHGLPSDHLLRYAHLGATPAEILGQFLVHPLDRLGAMIDAAEPSYAWILLGPCAGLPLLSPWTLLAIPTVVANLSSSLADQHVALSYANALLAPLLFIAAADGLARLDARLRPHLSLRGVGRARAFTLVVAFAASTSVVLPAIPSRRAALRPRLDARELAAARAFIASLAPEDAVMASISFLPALAHHRRLIAPWGLPGFVPDALIVDASEPSIWPWRDPLARRRFLEALTAEGYEGRSVGRVIIFRRVTASR